jgi:hypothetical protein
VSDKSGDGTRLLEEPAAAGMVVSPAISKPVRPRRQTVPAAIAVAPAKKKNEQDAAKESGHNKPKGQSTNNQKPGMTKKEGEAKNEKYMVVYPRGAVIRDMCDPKKKGSTTVGTLAVDAMITALGSSRLPNGTFRIRFKKGKREGWVSTTRRDGTVLLAIC